MPPRGFQCSATESLFAPDKITDPEAVLFDFLGNVDGEYEAAAALTDDPLLLQKLKEQRDFQKEVPTRFAQLSDEEYKLYAIN